MNIPLHASKIDLSNQNLTEIPKEIFRCKNLKKLNLSHNKIKVIPVELNRLKYLKNLDLSYNQISTLYAGNFIFTKLEVLILRNNKLKTLPKQLGKLNFLRKLSLAGNKLKALPEEISGLKMLESLNISDNDFDIFPDSIQQLNMLKRIWVNNNNFQNFPSADLIKSLPNLQAIYCYSALGINSDDTSNLYSKLVKIKGNCFQQFRIMSLKEDKPYNTPTAIELKNEKPLRGLNGKGAKIFISYSSADLKWTNRVKVALKSMELEGADIDIWDDKRIDAGDLWKKEIEKAIAAANVAILLVSHDFLASEFICSREIPPLLNKALEDGTKILPIIIGKCRFKESVLKGYQSINPISKPLEALSTPEVNDVLYQLTKEIDKVLV